MEDESVIFIRHPHSPEGMARLRFTPQEIVSVGSAACGSSYVAERDYHWTPRTNIITLTRGSRIRAWDASELRKPKRSQPFDCSHRDGGMEILYATGREYHDMQVSVTSRHSVDAWKCPLPSYAGDYLPRTLGKLHRGSPLNIVIFGDSISEGANSSASYPAPPFLPGYPDLLADRLKRAYSSPLTIKNLSKGGMATDWGCQEAPVVGAESPDLVILAFGMNDASMLSAESYQENVRRIVETVREGVPAVEFILVSSMLSNPDWLSIEHSRLFEYRSVLSGMVGVGSAVADVTSIWQELLRVKPFHDINGNGVNHPNDFGYRIYAEVLGSLLIKE